VQNAARFQTTLIANISCTDRYIKNVGKIKFGELCHLWQGVDLSLLGSVHLLNLLGNKSRFLNKFIKSLHKTWSFEL